MIKFILGKLSVIGILATLILWAITFCALVQKVMFIISLSKLTIVSLIVSLITVALCMIAFRREEDDNEDS